MIDIIKLSKHFKTFYRSFMKSLLGIIMIMLVTGFVLPSYAQLYGDQSSSSTPSYAQQNQVKATDKGSVKVGFYTDPSTPNTTDQTKLAISFLNKDSGITQQHIDYKVFIKKGSDQVFGIAKTHTAEGTVTVPFQFTDSGTYQVTVEVDGILFQPIPPETATFTVDVATSSVPEFPLAPIVLLASITFLVIFYRTKFLVINR